MFIDLSKAKEISPEITKYKENPDELYKYIDTNRLLSLSKYLEDLDPSEIDDAGNRIGKFDAFDRHVMSLGLTLNGPNQLNVEQLYAQATYLMPELVKREIEKGMSVADRFSYKDLVAVVVPHKGLTYNPLYIPDLDTDTAAKKKKYSPSVHNEGAELSKLSIKAREKSVYLKDYGLAIDMSYKVLKNYPWQDWALVLNLVGANIAAQYLTDIYSLGTTGDGTVGSATDVFGGTDDTLSYQDLVTAFASFYQPFSMNAILADIDTFKSILSLAQFTDPQSGWKFQNDGTVVSPMGAKLKQINSSSKVTVTAKEAVLLDTKFAVRQTKSQELMVESAKIIDRKLEQCAVSEESVFSIIADGAIKQMEWHS